MATSFSDTPLLPSCCYFLYPLITLLILSNNLFGTFCLSHWYLLIALCYHLIALCYHLIALYYRLITLLASSGYSFGTFWIPFVIFCLPLCCLLLTPLVPSRYLFDTF
jgi:hypothetical protein